MVGEIGMIFMSALGKDWNDYDWGDWNDYVLLAPRLPDWRGILITSHLKTYHRISS